MLSNLPEKALSEEILQVAIDHHRSLLGVRLVLVEQRLMES